MSSPIERSPGLYFIPVPGGEIGPCRFHATKHNSKEYLDTSNKIVKWWDNWKCDYCQTPVTPERRLGPRGRNTLCNACGLQEAKVKKMAAAALKAEQDRVHSKMGIGFLLN